MLINKKYKKLDAKLDALKVGVSHYLQEVALKQRIVCQILWISISAWWKLLTENHAYPLLIGRRSFASNFYGKIPTPLLMEATGHSTEQMFQRYISSTNTERTRSQIN